MRFLRASTIIALASAALCLGCATAPPQPRHAYERTQADPATLSRISYPPPSFVTIILYRVDGRPNLGVSGNLVPATYTNPTDAGFEVLVRPGQHTLEFYNVHKTPFDTAPLNYQTLSFSTEAGKTYVLSGKEGAWRITSGGAVVPSTMGSVPVLPEIPAGAPSAKLVVKNKSVGDLVPWVFRIDGMIAPRMNYFEPKPRWVVMNEVSVGKVDIRHGSLEIPLSPGTHTIEYAPEYRELGILIYGTSVKTAEFTVAAGQLAILSVAQPEKGKESQAAARIEIK